MSINETIVNKGTSSETNPTATISDIVIEGNGKGAIILEEKVTGGKWVPITNRTGGYCISTPDSTITYRFRAIDVEDAVRVFMGP